MGLQHVNPFILYVSNRNVTKPKEQTHFALRASQTPTCLKSVCISASDTKKVSHGSKSWLKRCSLPQNFCDSVKQHCSASDQKSRKNKPNPKLPYTMTATFTRTQHKRDWRKQIRWKGLPPIAWKWKIFLEVSRYFIYIYIIYILFIALAINM